MLATSDLFLVIYSFIPFLKMFSTKPHSSVSSIHDLRTGGCWFDAQTRPIFFPSIDDKSWQQDSFLPHPCP